MVLSTDQGALVFICTGILRCANDILFIVTLKEGTQ